MYREILTKAIIAKGKKEIKENKIIQTEHNISKVLGCWLINHKHNLKHDQQKIFIEGSFEAYLWYGYDNDTNCNLMKQVFTFEDEIPYMFTMESSTLNEDNDFKEYVIKHPTCTSMKYENQTIFIDIEREYLVDIIGETKLKIKVDDVIIDEIINTDYVKSKKE